ncbi:tripartite tricarboxylate transporter permease [Acuticoccus sp.]|uniref:tripartite tricarboxylate transporter permease n=1 Tax=Acuticoccus sp. TaxID=1904378 RepID=UPI003B5209DC
MDIIQGAFGTLLSGSHPVYLIFGVLLGLAVGVFPGLGGAAGISLVIPFVYGMDPTSALALMIGLLAVVSTGDTFTSVLMGIPGSAAAQATVMDGFPLARQGQAARALSAAFLSSMIGGVFGALLLTLFIQVARPLVLAFGSAELLMLSILGLSVVGALSGRSIEKGLIAAGLGLLLGAVGGAPATGEIRMTGGSVYLSDGLSLVVLGLGLFAVPEIIDLLSRGKAIAEHTRLGSGWGQGLRDVVSNRWLVLRCSALGSLLGAIPGIGGTVIDWIAYAHVVQVTKDRSGFGKGEIRGVIAPESANNAKEGGALVPTLIFGIPGSGATAIFLGALILIGVQPGVTMIRSDLETVYVIIWSLALANIIGAGLCVVLARPVARLTEIPFSYLAPFILSMICFAAFQATRSFGDLVLLAVMGLLGIVMKRLGWPRPALLIGFVLSAGVERYLYQSMQFYGWSWFERPIVLVLGLMSLASIILGVRIARSVSTEGETAPNRGAELGFLAVVLVGLVAAGMDSIDRAFLGRIFPLGVVAATGALWLIFVARTRPWRPSPAGDEDATAAEQRQYPLTLLFAGFAAFIAAIFVVGFLPAMVLLFAVVLYGMIRARIVVVAGLTAFAVIGMMLVAEALNLRLPEGLVMDLLT